MANTKRREKFIDRNGNMFIPISVEGGQYNYTFFTTTKFVTLTLLLFGLFYLIYIIQNLQTKTFLSVSFWVCIYLIIFIYSFRFIIFEEKFYYKMYKEMQKYQISTPATYWNIASIKDSDEGTIITYADAKIAVLVKLERDTITGKTSEFRETHYDAISDFYRDLAIKKYSFVQMNLMEPAGKDPRLAELSKVVYKSDNKNIQKLMELQVGHIKNITHTSLYESDYFLIYTTEVSKLDTIINDVTESLFKILDGAYLSYMILSSKEITELVKEESGVSYFNSTEASLLMYSNTIGATNTPFEIKGLVWEDGLEQELELKDKNRLRNITSGVISETLKTSDMALRKTLYRDKRKNEIGFDFDDLYKDNKNTTIEKEDEYVDF